MRVEVLSTRLFKRRRPSWRTTDAPGAKVVCVRAWCAQCEHVGEAARLASGVPFIGTVRRRNRAARGKLRAGEQTSR